MIDRYTYKVIPEDSMAFLALKRGEIDIKFLNPDQYKKQANLRILIPPLDKQLRNLVNAIIKKKIILLSLMKIADFKELYLKVMEREAVPDREYDAVTFEIPVENAGALTSLITSMTFLDERKIKELTKVIEEKQDEEISKIRLGEPV